jgi:DNA adenine methylase
MTSAMRALERPSSRLLANPPLRPFIKWPGGKSSELAAIAAAAPPIEGRYIDPFVGGGAVLLAVPSGVAAWANDTSVDLIALNRAAAGDRSELRNALAGLALAWERLDEFGDLYEAVSLEYRHGAGAVGQVSRVVGRIAAAVAQAGSQLGDEFSRRLERDLPGKLGRVRHIEHGLARHVSQPDLLANIEGSVRAAFYMAVRARYNARRSARIQDETRSADFFFLREFAYAAMFRFNSRDEFNVPYGGMTYNGKSFAEKVHQLYDQTMLTRLQNTTWRCMDFELFLREAEVSRGDFVFADPPYDSDFSSYDNLPFGPRDQERLESVLAHVPANVMVVIKDTPLIRGLYSADRWNLASAEKTYMWTIKSRNDRAATHLTITNY